MYSPKHRLVNTIVLFAVGMQVAGMELRSDPDAWPLAFTTAGYQVQVHAPQPESLEGYRFTARSVVQLRRPNSSTSVFGAVWGKGVLEMDRVSRLGRISSFTVIDARFPDMNDTDEIMRLRHMLSEEIPRHAGPVSLDWLAAALEHEKEGMVTYANTPPEIIYRERPSVLVFIDGDPVMEPLADRSLRMERVVNTPFLMVRDQQGVYFVMGSGNWFRSPTLEGPWTREHRPGRELRQLMEMADSTAALEARAADGSVVVPEIVVRTRPAILLDLDGPPSFRTMPGAGLLYATNTDKELFLEVASQEYFLLSAGRWFSTRDIATGPWSFRSSDQLPPEFALIPEGSAKDGVLVHVSGTDAARDAVRDANIPQTAQVDRRSTTLTVEWDGEPEFEHIVGTDVDLALNASTVLLRIGGHYHALDNAVWFDGPTPDGPWAVSTEVPASVNNIPPESPAYNARYVQVYDHTPEVVYVGYTPGYLGSFVQHGTIIYGTGFYYPPPPRWRPRPFTWGMAMYYDPWWGWGPTPSWGWSWYYPSWYGWGWGAHRPMPWSWGWGGPYGYFPPVIHHHHHHFGHRPSTVPPGRQPGSGGRPGLSSSATQVVASPPRDLYGMRQREGVRPTRVQAQPPQRPTAVAPDRGARQPARSPDHFTDRDGNIYRGQDGRLERYEGGRWNQLPRQPDQRPARTPSPVQERQRPATAPPPVQRPQARPEARPSAPQQRPHDPGRIQQDRSRGIQRMQDFQHHQQRSVRPAPAPAPRQAPAARPAPPRQAPATAPARPAPQRNTAPPPARNKTPERGRQ